MKRFAWLGVLLAWSVAGVAQAELLPILMDPSYNGRNDYIQDESWAVPYSYKVQEPETVVEVYGLAAADKVNDEGFNRTVWAVFSFKQNGDFQYNPSMPKWLAPYANDPAGKWTQHVASTEKTLNFLLGLDPENPNPWNPLIDADAMIALVELKTPPKDSDALGIDNLKEQVPKENLDAQLIELQEKIRTGEAQWLFAFGIEDSKKDVVLLGPFSSLNKAEEEIAVSLMCVNERAGVRESWFNKLRDNPSTIIRDESLYDLVSSDTDVIRWMRDPADESTVYAFTDTTKVYLNVVPEPASLISLALALAGGGLGLIRRRKA